MHIGTVAPRTAAGGHLPFPGTWDEWVADDGAPRPVADALEPLLREAGLGDTHTRMWPTVDGLYVWLWSEARAAYDAEPEAVYDEVRLRCLRFHGELAEAHLLDHAFHALRLGAEA